MGGVEAQIIPQQTAPVIDRITVKPTGTPIPRGQIPTRFVIRGSGFTESSRVFFDTTEVTTIFKAADRLQVRGATVPLTFFVTDRTISVRVVNGNQNSNTASIVVGTGQTAPVPATIARVEPSTPVVNQGGNVTLRVNVLDANNATIQNPTVTYQSLNPAVLTVTGSGTTATVNGITSGTGTVQVTSGSAQLLVTFSVNAVASIDSGVTGDSDILVLSRRRDLFPGTGQFQPSQTTEEIIFQTNRNRHTLRTGTFNSGLTDFAGLNNNSGNVDAVKAGARFNAPLAMAQSDAVYVVDSQNQSIRRVDATTGEVLTHVNLDDIKAVAPSVTTWSPRYICAVPNQDMYVTDSANNVIWRIEATGNPNPTVSLYAGGIGQSGSTDGAVTAARFNNPQGIELSQNSNSLIVVDRGNNSTRIISLDDNTVSTLRAGSSTVDPTRTIDTDMLGGFQPNQVVTFTDPRRIDVDAAGNLYIADGNTVRVLTLRGATVTAVSDLAPTTSFQNVVGLSITSAGELLVFDSDTGRITRISVPAPTITSVSPTSINANTAAEITVRGTNFSRDTQVFVDRIALPVPGVMVRSSTELRFPVPPQPIGGTVNFSVRNRGGSAAGSFTITGGTTQSTIQVIATPPSKTLAAGQMTMYSLTVQRLNYTGGGTFTVTGLPQGARASFNNPSLGPSDSALLTVITDRTTPVGTYPLTISLTPTGTPAPTVAPARVSLVVQPTLPGSVTLSTLPTPIAIPVGQRGDVQININRRDTSVPVNLAVTGLPTGVTATFNPPNPVAARSATMTLAVGAQTTPGTYDLSVTATGPNVPTVPPLPVRLVVGGSTSPGTVAIEVSPTTSTIFAGSQARYVVSLQRTNFAGPVTLTAAFETGSRSDITFNFDQNQITGNSAVLIVTAPPTAQGQYSFRVNGTATGATVTSSPVLTLQVNAVGGATILVTPASQTVFQGGAARYQIQINRSGFAGSVALRVVLQGTSVPPGLSAQFDPSATIGNSSVLTVQTTSATPPGSYSLFVTGDATGATITQSPVFTLQVNQAGSVSLAVTPASQTVSPGGAVTYQVQLNRVGFAGAVNLQAQFQGGTPPTGLSVSIASNPTTGNLTSLTIQSGTSTPLGTYSFVVTGTATGATVTQSNVFSITVQSPPSVTLGINPTLRTINKTSSLSTTYTVTVTTTNFNGTVTVSVAGVPTGSGISTSFTPFSGNTSTLTITVSSGTPNTTYNLQLTGSAPGVTIAPVAFQLVVTGSIITKVEPVSPSFLTANAGVTMSVNEGALLPVGLPGPDRELMRGKVGIPGVIDARRAPRRHPPTGDEYGNRSR